MVPNIKIVFITIICTALFFGCSAVSAVTADDHTSGTGATTENTPRGTGEDKKWPAASSIPIGSIDDIILLIEREEVAFGRSWIFLTDDEAEAAGLDINESEELFRVYGKKHEEGETTHRCWFTWQVPVSGGMQVNGYPYGCVDEGH